MHLACQGFPVLKKRALPKDIFLPQALSTRFSYPTWLRERRRVFVFPKKTKIDLQNAIASTLRSIRCTYIYCNIYYILVK